MGPNTHDYINYIQHTTPENASTTQPKHHVGYIEDTPTPTLDMGRSAVPLQRLEAALRAAIPGGFSADTPVIDERSPVILR